MSLQEKNKRIDRETAFNYKMPTAPSSHTSNIKIVKKCKELVIKKEQD
jgi:hypothetical protein